MIRPLVLALVIAVPAMAQVTVPQGIAPRSPPDPIADPVGLFLHICLGGDMTAERGLAILRGLGLSETTLDQPLSVFGGVGDTRRFDPGDPARRDEPSFEIADPQDVSGVGVCTVLMPPEDGPAVAFGRLEPMLRGRAPLRSEGRADEERGDLDRWDAWLIRTAAGPRLLVLACPIFPVMGPVEGPASGVAHVTVAELPPPFVEALGARNGALPADLPPPVGPGWASDLTCKPFEGQPA